MKTFAALLVLAAASTSLAACPNQCSGHGRCTENDICECYKQTGTTWRQRVGYSGADCSQRTCPLGIAYDMLSTNRGTGVGAIKLTKGADFDGSENDYGAAGKFGVMVKKYALGESKTFHVRISKEAPSVPLDSAPVEMQWKLDEHDAYSAPMVLGKEKAGGDEDGSFDPATSCTLTNPCELIDNGDGTGSTGVYVYVSDLSATTVFEAGNVFSFTYDHQEGRTYEYGSSNNAHQQIECSGRGSCDTASGRCSCFAGFSGEACQRTVCPNDCSGHGVCQSQKRFAADANNKDYSTAYDAEKQMGCMCDSGFRGPDCSLIECPSGDDPMGYFGGDGTKADGGDKTVAMDCSGRGLCDYSSGECTCFKGYFGERCEYQTNFV